jgi:hypothetical protein
MTDPVDKFLSVAPPIDAVREEAARCAEETAKMERGERGPLRLTEDPRTSEFSGEAAGTAAEVAMVVMEALKAQGVRAPPVFCWMTAAMLLRNGWQRGHKLVGHTVGEKGTRS